VSLGSLEYDDGPHVSEGTDLVVDFLRGFVAPRLLRQVVRASLYRILLRDYQLYGRRRLKFPWISDLLSVLDIHKKLCLRDAKLTFQSVSYIEIFQVLQFIISQGLESTVSLIRFPYSRRNINLNGCGISTASINFHQTVEKLMFLKHVEIGGNTIALLPLMNGLHLKSLRIYDKSLCAHTLAFYLFEVSRRAGDPYYTNLSRALESLSVEKVLIPIPVCQALVNNLPNVTEWNIVPDLSSAAATLPENSNTQSYLFSILPSVSVSLSALGKFQNNNFISLRHMKILVSNLDEVINMTALEQMPSLKHLEIVWLPNHTSGYINVNLLEIYEQVPGMFRFISELSLHHVSIVPSMFEKLAAITKLTTLSLLSCWVESDGENQNGMFPALKRVKLNLWPPRSALEYLLDSPKLEHLIIGDDSVQCFTESNSLSPLIDVLRSNRLVTLNKVEVGSGFVPSEAELKVLRKMHVSVLLLDEGTYEL